MTVSTLSPSLSNPPYFPTHPTLCSFSLSFSCISPSSSMCAAYTPLDVWPSLEEMLLNSVLFFSLKYIPKTTYVNLWVLIRINTSCMHSFLSKDPWHLLSCFELCLLTWRLLAEDESSQVVPDTSISNVDLMIRLIAACNWNFHYQWWCHFLSNLEIFYIFFSLVGRFLHIGFSIFSFPMRLKEKEAGYYRCVVYSFIRSYVWKDTPSQISLTIETSSPLVFAWWKIKLIFWKYVMMNMFWGLKWLHPLLTCQLY